MPVHSTVHDGNFDTLADVERCIAVEMAKHVCEGQIERAQSELLARSQGDILLEQTPTAARRINEKLLHTHGVRAQSQGDFTAFVAFTLRSHAVRIIGKDENIRAHSG